MLSVACQGFPSLSAIFAVRASCRLPQLRCWVAPSSKAVCQAKPATPLLLPPLLGKPSACLSLAAVPPGTVSFLHCGRSSRAFRIAAARPRQKRHRAFRAARGRPDGPLAQRVSAPLLYGPHPAPVGTVCAGPSAISVYPSNQPCHGPFRPGPRRPSASRTNWRSLPGSGSLRSPRPCAVKARQRPTRQTASGATLRSRWSLRALGGLETQSRGPASRLVGICYVGGPLDRPAFETLNHQGLL